jgi:hypothetical protein
MPFNVLLLPLLGGYVFITYWNHTRFTAKRYSGERLLIHAALAGVVLLGLSYMITRLISFYCPTIYSLWHEVVPFDHAGPSLGALLLGAGGWPVMNLLTDEAKEIAATIKESNDYLEILLNGAQEETRSVAITLKNGKVYIGLVVASFNPAYERKYILLLPTTSGYRESGTHALVLTTDYTAVYDELMASDQLDVLQRSGDFQTVIPVAEILTASLFDYPTFERFSAHAGGAVSSPPPDDASGRKDYEAGKD